MNLEQYQSLGRAMYKGIPIEQLAEAQAHMRKNIKGLRYIFRGPRYDRMRVSTLKQHAHSFDIYFK